MKIISSILLKHFLKYGEIFIQGAKKLKLFMAIDNHIMSDLENRKNYGVTKSWPPKF